MEKMKADFHQIIYILYIYIQTAGKYAEINYHQSLEKCESNVKI